MLEGFNGITRTNLSENHAVKSNVGELMFRWVKVFVSAPVRICTALTAIFRNEYLLSCLLMCKFSYWASLDSTMSVWYPSVVRVSVLCSVCENFGFIGSWHSANIYLIATQFHYWTSKHIHEFLGCLPYADINGGVSKQVSFIIHNYIVNVVVCLQYSIVIIQRIVVVVSFHKFTAKETNNSTYFMVGNYPHLICLAVIHILDESHCVTLPVIQHRKLSPLGACDCPTRELMRTCYVAKMWICFVVLKWEDVCCVTDTTLTATH